MSNIRERIIKVGENNVEVEQICGCDICGIHVIDRRSYGEAQIKHERDILSARFSQLQDPNFVEDRLAAIEEEFRRLNNIEAVMNEEAKKEI